MNTALLKLASVRRQGYRRWDVPGKADRYVAFKYTTLYASGKARERWLVWHIHPHHSGSGGIHVDYSQRHYAEALDKALTWVGRAFDPARAVGRKKP
ncbi:hypothetical protein CC53_gp114 [Rhizobium phage vB_RleS_L338C]|uniref:hypothetical protein n=1 Tax=Rhizobium phage vB_RleS_L338C TaxID=1414737 RepID=UPI0003D7EB31|nr:hypothetical protein CC53_gp114 [Rhizobium phage vB_RleS_L338C]AHC30531.1 hypothetical protein L338C_114 [Rhizobium phage vB_RleS_L338C]QNH72152.1 hypothetical protein P11VFA_036 [Rhizobium phage P11VFA]